MNSIKIAIPSMGRHKTIIEDTISTIGDKYEIFVFVPRNEEENYKSELYTAVPHDAIGIAATRNVILNHFMEGQRIVSLDDDIKCFDKGEHIEGSIGLGGNPKVARHKMEKEEIYTFWEQSFEKIANRGYKLFTMHPTSGSIFMRCKDLYGLYFAIGTMCGIINSEIRYDENLKVKEDYAFSIEHYEKFGGMLRDDSVGVNAKHYTNKGGCESFRTLELEKQAVDYLMDKYPAYLSRRSRKGHPHELVLKRGRKHLKINEQKMF